MLVLKIQIKRHDNIIEIFLGEICAAASAGDHTLSSRGRPSRNVGTGIVSLIAPCSRVELSPHNDHVFPCALPSPDLCRVSQGHAGCPDHPKLVKLGEPLVVECLLATLLEHKRRVNIVQTNPGAGYILDLPRENIDVQFECGVLGEPGECVIAGGASMADTANKVSSARIKASSTLEGCDA